MLKVIIAVKSKIIWSILVIQSRTNIVCAALVPSEQIFGCEVWCGGGGGLLVASGSVRAGGDDILDPDTILCLLFSRGFCSPAVVETLKKKNPTSHR